jgi:hypothetical protein
MDFNPSRPDANLVAKVFLFFSFSFVYCKSRLVLINYLILYSSQYKAIAPESATDEKIWEAVCAFNGDDNEIQNEIGSWYVHFNIHMFTLWQFLLFIFVCAQP